MPDRNVEQMEQEIPVEREVERTPLDEFAKMNVGEEMSNDQVEKLQKTLSDMDKDLGDQNLEIEDLRKRMKELEAKDKAKADKEKITEKDKDKTKAKEKTDKEAGQKTNQQGKSLQQHQKQKADAKTTEISGTAKDVGMHKGSLLTKAATGTVKIAGKGAMTAGEHTAHEAANYVRDQADIGDVR